MRGTTVKRLKKEGTTKKEYLAKKRKTNSEPKFKQSRRQLRQAQGGATI